jgi:hypothetical protein
MSTDSDDRTSDAVYRRAHRLSRKRNHDGYEPDDWRAEGHTTGMGCAACFAFADLVTQIADVLVEAQREAVIRA